MIAHASIYLDTRKKNKKKCYPVKLRVYHQGDRKLYSLGIYLSEDDFKKSYHTLKPKGEHAEHRQKLLDKENDAKKILEKMRVFTFSEFERRMFKGISQGKDLYSYF
ncbi:MAG: Arm DNA-binding domain-containing protein, partial [Sphingobacteriales bacterium]